jgi:hypothetical protein
MKCIRLRSRCCHFEFCTSFIPPPLMLLNFFTPKFDLALLLLADARPSSRQSQRFYRRLHRPSKYLHSHRILHEGKPEGKSPLATNRFTKHQQSAGHSRKRGRKTGQHVHRLPRGRHPQGKSVHYVQSLSDWSHKII